MPVLQQHGRRRGRRAPHFLYCPCWANARQHRRVTTGQGHCPEAGSVLRPLVGRRKVQQRVVRAFRRSAAALAGRWGPQTAGPVGEDGGVLRGDQRLSELGAVAALEAGECGRRPRMKTTASMAATVLDESWPLDAEVQMVPVSTCARAGDVGSAVSGDRRDSGRALRQRSSPRPRRACACRRPC